MRLLLTTFGPYQEWTTNASQMAVERLDLASFDADISVRQYPVDFQQAKTHVLADHQQCPQRIVHVGQSKHASKVELEMLAVNFGREHDDAPYFELAPNGPAAIRCQVNYAGMVAKIAAEKIPVKISFHAGVFICNAVFYWSLLAAERVTDQPPIVFVHLPLDPAQRENNQPGGSLPIEQSTRALARVLEHLLQPPSLA